MKHKYLILNKNGEAYPIEKYLAKRNISKEIKALIEREALGISPKNDDSEPAYLKYANKLGFFHGRKMLVLALSTIAIKQT